MNSYPQVYPQVTIVIHRLFELSTGLSTDYLSYPQVYPQVTIVIHKKNHPDLDGF